MSISIEINIKESKRLWHIVERNLDLIILSLEKQRSHFEEPTGKVTSILYTSYNVGNALHKVDDFRNAKTDRNDL